MIKTKTRSLMAIDYGQVSCTVADTLPHPGPQAEIALHTGPVPPYCGSHANTSYAPLAPLPQVANPVLDTVTSDVGPPVVQAPQVAGIGVSVMGDWLQWPVAVNCTADPFAVAVDGVMLSDCSSRGPDGSAHPAITSVAAASDPASLSGNLFMAFPHQPPD